MKKLVILLWAMSASAFAQDHSAIIDQRQDAYSNIDEITEEVEFLIDGEDSDWALLEEHSLSLVNYSRSLVDAFPAGSQEGSKAKPAVWEQPEKFDKLLKQLIAGFEQFHQGALAKDADLAQAGLEQSMDTCKSCHRGYRSRR